MIRYCQPEPNQSDLSRKARGAKLECERLEAQIAATLKRAVTLAALIAASACGGLTSGESGRIDAGVIDVESGIDAGAKQTYAVGDICECDSVLGSVRVLSGLMCLVTEPSRSACELPQ